MYLGVEQSIKGVTLHESMKLLGCIIPQKFNYIS